MVSRPGLVQSRVLSTKSRATIGELQRLPPISGGFALLFLFATLRSVLPKALRWSIVELLGVWHWITQSLRKKAWDQKGLTALLV